MQPSTFASEALREIAVKAEFSQYEHRVVAQEPYAVSTWIDYFSLFDEHEANSCTKRFVERRAVSHLPKSWKLWRIHLSELVLEWTRSNSKNNKSNQQISLDTVITAFERALWTLSKFPRLWCMYGDFIQNVNTYNKRHGSDDETNQHLLHPTHWRNLWTRALQALPVTQHDKLWQVIVPYCLSLSNEDDSLPVETVMALLEKAIQFDQVKYAVPVAEWLVSRQSWKYAASIYEKVLQQQLQAPNAAAVTGTASPDDTSTSDLLTSYIELCTQHVNDLDNKNSNWEAILSQVLQVDHTKGNINNNNFGHVPSNDAVVVPSSQSQTGLLWTLWADAYVRQGQFDKARSLYQQGLQCVPTVRDFAVVYQAYWQLEETLVQHISEAMGDDDNDDTMQAEENDEAVYDDSSDNWDILLLLSAATVKDTRAEAEVTLEQALERAEYVLQQRPLWLNAVQLRQDPRNVSHWLERAQLFWDRNEGTSATRVLEQALNDLLYGSSSSSNDAQTPPRIKGQPSRLVERLVQYLQELDQLDKIRYWLDRICLSEPIPLGITWRETCWTLWIELELQLENWTEALSLVRQAVASEPKKRASLKLWDLYLDLEESLGTVQTTKDAYKHALQTKVATVQHVLNFASFLKEQNYFEESFTAYEKGIDLFNFPHRGAKVLWQTYLHEFLLRYQGKKLERTRDLFERCLEHCPAEDCIEFHLINGQWEEEYGLTKRALSVYRAMCNKATKTDKYQAFLLWIAKTAKYLGADATRDVYEEAMKQLDDVSAAKIGIEFAQLETRLQQTDRARAIYSYAAQMADPRVLPEYWKAWNDFEIANGSEETFREMLRIKRSVEAAYSTVNYNATRLSEQAASETLTTEEAMRMIANQEGVDLDTVAGGDKVNKMAGFVRGSETQSTDERSNKMQKYMDDDNGGGDEDEDAIDIDDIDAEIEAAAAEGAAETSDVAASASVVDNDGDVTTKPVPAAVFGGLKQS